MLCLYLTVSDIMKSRIVVVNTDSKEFSYGGVSPIMRNMHPYLMENFDVDYLFLPDSWKKAPGIIRFKMMIYLLFEWNRLKNCDFILSHIPEGSFIASFTGIPYCHIYHGNNNPMTVSRYWFGKYFKFVFDMFYKRIERTCPLKYTVGPVLGDKKKLFNPINHNVYVKPYEERHGFIFAGRLELVKNVDHLIRIYAKVPLEMRKKDHFYIAGFGTQEETLKALVSKLEMTEYIHFLGNLSNAQLVEEDSTKKILMMASRQEGLPTAIAEALSVGVPVVSTNVGDVSTVLKDNYNGFIFPLDFRDEDYIKAIILILSDYDRFSRNALESSKVFNAKEITENMVSEIHKVLNK